MVKKVFLGVIFCFCLLFGNTQNSNLDSARYYDELSEYKLSERYFEKAITSQTTKDSVYIETLISLARAKRINQKYSEGIEILNEAKDLSDSLKSSYLILKTSVNIGDYYRAIGGLEISLNYFNQLNPKDFEKYPKLLNQFYHRKAAVYNEWQHEAPEDSTHLIALEYSKQALKIARKFDWSDPLATSFNEMANIYEKDSKLEEALLYYDSACFIFKKSNVLDYINASRNKLRVLFTQKKYSDCIDFGKSLLTISKGKNWPYLEYPILHYMAQSYYAEGDSINGMKYDLLNKDKLIETNEARHEQDLSELQVEFDISNKEIEIESKEKVIQQSQTFQNRLMFLLGFLIILIGTVIGLYLNGIHKNKRLEALLKENAFLVGEANHRIKNNLQLIISLLSKEIRKTASTNSQQLLDIKAKIESISTLHQQLYLNEDKSTIDIKFYLDEIIENLGGVIKGKEVQVKSNIEVNDFPVEKSLHLGLLVTELIINSLKHAFQNIARESKEIKISLIEKNNYYVFTFSDNGKGLGENDNPKLVSLLTKQLKSKEKIIKTPGYNFEIEIAK